MNPPDLEYDKQGELRSAFENHAPGDIRLDDVASIEKWWTDASDEPNFIWLLRLTDGRWAAATGWTDYTGWDCQSAFTLKAFASREEAIRLGFTLNDRELLGELLPDDHPPEKKSEWVPFRERPEEGEG